VLTCFVRGIVVLGKRDQGVGSLVRELNGHCVVVFRLIGKPGERAEMRLLE
jgi:hypothetical protein